jgi:hypothetical protein
MNVHLDASHLLEALTHSRACGHVFIGLTPTNGNPIKLIGAFFTLCGILRFAVASAAKAKLGALFLSHIEWMIFQMTLEKLGHPQSKTPGYCNNTMAVGIANNTLKQQHLQ